MAASAHEQATVLALVKASPAEWYRTADVIARTGSAIRLMKGEPGAIPPDQVQYAEELATRVTSHDLSEANALMERMTAEGVRLLTVLDDDYPDNLHLIYNRPPFLWARGDFDPHNMRAIAVVGTRQATEHGRTGARRLAHGLADAGVTVLSGLARGIDTVAHTATLDAGGRTVAVIGSGISVPTYPPENEELARRISQQGAVVSQFWPDAPPRRTNFPLRNVVMSGMAAGTVVVEASATSGAKMQARLALEHGKQLFLPQQLVEEQQWARRYADRSGVTVVQSLDDILDVLVKLVQVPQQLSLI